MRFSTPGRLWIASLFAFLLCHASEAQKPSQPTLTSVVSPKMNSKSPLVKIGPELASLQKEYQVKAQTNARSRKAFEPKNNLIQVRPGGLVLIEAVAEGQNTDKLLTDLKAMGLQKPSVFGRMISGLMPIESLHKVATLSSLRFAKPAYRPVPRIGAVTGQGDKVMGVDRARLNANVQGRRSTIGVLSDSYNNLGGASDGVLSGDLPGKGNPNGYFTPINVLEDLETSEDDSGSDEGRGMLEIIHDLAPAAKLAFHTAFNGQVDFATGILELHEKGCDIIVDDIIYFDEPFFQDGIIAQAVDSVKRMGATYFSSAGNNGRDSYQKSFKSGGVVSFGSKTLEGGYQTVDAHNFAPAGKPKDVTQEVVIPAGGVLYLAFQWDEPFYSLGDGSGPGSMADLDIYLLSKDTTEIVAGSNRPNIAGDPVELFGFFNDGTYGSDTFNILIDKFEGPAPTLIKYIAVNSTITFNEYHTSSATVFGHPNSSDAVAVGAAFFIDTPPYGQTPPLAESFSAVGGVPILFDLNGKAIQPLYRGKPEITATDGVSTTFFGQPVLDQFLFFGTSASAPHAAAIAALMKEASGKDLDRYAIVRALKSTAIDMDKPGFDYNTGAGLIDAEAAVASVTRPGVRYFTLVDADSQKDIKELQEGEELNLSNLPSKNLNIRANTNPAEVGSVSFVFNGRRVVDNTGPYSVAGEEGDLYKALNPPLSPNVFGGAYQISAAPYSEVDAKGDRGAPLTVNFKVVDNRVVSFQLINVETGNSLGEIKDGDVINLSALPTTKLNIRAITNPRDVGSVVFDFNGKKVVENYFPYALGGDNAGRSYKALEPSLTPGKYTLSAAPYQYNRGQGSQGVELKVSFTVVTSGTARLASFEGGTQLKVHPNPFSEKTTVAFSLAETEQATLHVYDLKGSLIAPLHDGLAESGKIYQYELKAGSLQPGMYISRLVTSKGVLTQKLILTR